MDRLEITESKLLPWESYILKSGGVKLYDGERKSPFERGDVILTTHRLIWSGVHSHNRDCVNLSLHLHLVVYIEEEKPALSFVKSKKIVLYLMEAKLEGCSPVPSSEFNYVKLSFSDGVDTDFLNALHDVLRQKKWELSVKQGVNVKWRSGIVGIERNIEQKQKAIDQDISYAFQDLSKLMTMAKDMVNMSRSISSKLKDKQGEITDDETVKFKSYLLSLGIEDPVTRDIFQTEREYFEKLATEIVKVLRQPVEEAGGVMVLSDAYCRLNRARGLELLSPEDFLSGCKMMQTLSMPIVLRQFDSGVKLLQSASHDDVTVAEDTALVLRQRGNVTSEELARVLGIPVLLAKQRLLTAEKYGKACRDDHIEGLRFYVNRFLEE